MQNSVDWKSATGPWSWKKLKQNKTPYAFPFHQDLLLTPPTFVPSTVGIRIRKIYFAPQSPLWHAGTEGREFFFLSLKIFLWNGGKSIKGWIGEPWGAGAGRLLREANIMEPWFPSLCCLKAVWGLPKKFSLFCGFWENLEHKFTKKMDVWITSFKQIRSLCPSAFTVGKKNSLTKLSEVWRQAWALLPRSPSNGGGLLGKAGEMKSDAWSVKEGCPKPGRISQQLGPAPGSQRGKEFGQQTQERREGLCIYSSCHSQSVTQKWRERSGGGRATAQGALERWVPPPLRPPCGTQLPSSPASVRQLHAALKWSGSLASTDGMCLPSSIHFHSIILKILPRMGRNPKRVKTVEAHLLLLFFNIYLANTFFNINLFI